MNYYSTRDQKKAYPVSAAQAIKQGLASDGGLFIPESLPELSKALLSELCADDYATRAAKIMKLFLSDYTYEELLSDCQAAYAPESFRGGAAPLCAVGNDGIYSLDYDTEKLIDIVTNVQNMLFRNEGVYCVGKTGTEDGSDKTVAGLIIDGCNMGIKSLCGYKNQYSSADTGAQEAAKRLIDIEEKLAHNLREYL